MANKEHLTILRKGVDEWNQWREKNVKTNPDLSFVNLSGQNFQKINFQNADLRKANLKNANLSNANLNHSYLAGADFSGANLQNSSLVEANLIKTNFIRTNLSNAKLRYANLIQADFEGANLSDANLYSARLIGTNLSNAILCRAKLNNVALVKTNLTHADLTNCSIYGIAAWDLILDKTKQKDLIITPYGESSIITVDNLEVAQFIYLLLHNKKIREVIDTVGKKAVLILGRFTKLRKRILNVIKDMLRDNGYLPILFDFNKPSSRDIAETVSTLAHLSRFIIADITDARAVPQELQSIVPNIPSVAVQPILQSSKEEYGMFDHFKRYPWVLNLFHYEGIDDLVSKFHEQVIGPVEAKVLEIRI